MEIGYLFHHVHYSRDAFCDRGRLVKISTLSTSVTDPNKTYNFVVVKRQCSASGLD